LARRKGAKTRTVTRRRKRNVKKRVGKSIQSNWKKMSAAAGVLGFVSNVTGQDMAASAGQPIATKAQAVISSLFGRISGYNPFPASTGGAVPQTISIEGIFNRISGIGAGLLAFSLIPVKILPHKRKARILGTSLLSAGVLSGLFMGGNPHNTNLLTSSRPALTVSSSQVSYT